MSLIELRREPLEGELNINSFFANSQGGILLNRRPKDNPQIMRSIAHEYHSIGFTDQGGRFRRRTLEEQIAFVKNAAAHGLRVLAPLVDDNAVYFPYLEGAQTLDDYLSSATKEDLFRVVYELFDDLRKAHKQNIIYGDRWPPNILVIPRFGVINVDFDIKISGRPAKEFEVAQATYYTLCAGKDNVIPLLTEILTCGKDWFDFSLVAEFLQKHAVHFLHDSKYGGVENETNMLIELVHNKMSSN